MAKYLSCESSAGGKKLQSFVFVFPVSPSFRLCENLRALQFLGAWVGGEGNFILCFSWENAVRTYGKMSAFPRRQEGRGKCGFLRLMVPQPPAFSGGGIPSLWRAMHLFWVNHYTFRCSCSFSVMGQGSRGGMTLCAFFAFWSKKKDLDPPRMITKE